MKSKDKKPLHWEWIIGALLWLFSSCPSLASPLMGRVVDTEGDPVEDAVISVVPLDAGTLPPESKSSPAIMDQWKKQFIPYVLPIQAGMEVSFPNRDNIKHHVYSFSPAKRFELKLYSGTPTDPVAFDKSGVVALGCNIHDWMLGFIYVVETPYFGKTGADGTVAISDIPPGKYRVHVWHPRLREQREDAQTVTLGSASGETVSFTLSLKRERRRAQPDFEERYADF